MIDTVVVADLAAGGPVDLALAGDGRPDRPLLYVDLTGAAATADVARAIDAARGSLPLLVGVAPGPLDPSMHDLVEAMDLTLTAAVEASPGCVAVPDLYAALASLSTAVRDNPRAAVVVGHVLRETATLPVRAGLAAEAAAYSMLLGGPEFAGWLRRRGPAHATAAAAGPPVAVSRTDDVLGITLQRPARRNAMDASLREALVEALTVAAADPELQVVLRGAGPSFCSGGDLDEFGTADDPVAAYLVRLDRHPGWLLHRLRARTRVEVHGACIGAGVEMAAFAGLVVAAPDSYFGLPELGMGLVPGAGGTVSIPRRIGRWRTAWMALTGTRVDAEVALRWGLVDALGGSG